MGKLTGVLLLLLIRGFELWLSGHGLVDTKGAIATAVAVSLFAVELQSVAHHREELGASPIPVLGSLLAWMHAWGKSRLPPVPPNQNGENTNGA